MRRISTDMSNNDLQYHLRIKESQLNKVQNQMGDQQRVQNLRDDPVAAANSTRYQSFINRMEQYTRNAQQSQSDLRIAEGYVTQANDVMHRLSELAIQGSNGTYTPQDMKNMAVEVDQLLNELVSLGNAAGPDGHPIFAGDKIGIEPFRVVKGNVEGGEGQVITSVEYIGTIGKNKTELMEGEKMSVTLPGNKVFWAENQTIYSAVDAQNYQVPGDTKIFIDGKGIDLRAGDNVHTIMGRINSADVAVKAKIDPVTNGLTLETTQPHQIWLQDPAGSTVLADLGLTSPRGFSPPNNLHQDARRFGGSLFDSVIRLRDSMFAGNHDAIGGRDLASVRAAQDNLATTLADIGARDERLANSLALHGKQIPEVTEKDSKAMDVDITDALMNLKMLENTHKASLSAASRILQPTLLDFMR